MSRGRRAILGVLAAAGVAACGDVVDDPDAVAGIDSNPEPPNDGATADAPGSDPDAPASSFDAGLCPDTPDGCSAFSCGGETCYIHCANILEQREAGEICSAWGGRLVKLETEAESSCLSERIPCKAGCVMWIDLMQDTDASSPATGWAWSDGPLGAFQPWRTGEPNDADGIENGQEQCAVRSSIDGTWNDVACLTFAGYVCEQ